MERIKESKVKKYVLGAAFGKNESSEVNAGTLVDFILTESKNKTSIFPDFQVFLLDISPTSIQFISWDTARVFLFNVLHESMAYGDWLMSEDDCDQIIDEFFGQFKNPQFLSNYATPLPGGEFSAWDPLTTFTFDMLIGVIDQENVGFFIFIDED